MQTNTSLDKISKKNRHQAKRQERGNHQSPNSSKENTGGDAMNQTFTKHLRHVPYLFEERTITRYGRITIHALDEGNR